MQTLGETHSDVDVEDELVVIDSDLRTSNFERKECDFLC